MKFRYKSNVLGYHEILKTTFHVIFILEIH